LFSGTVPRHTQKWGDSTAMATESLAAVDQEALRPDRSNRKRPSGTLRHVILVEPRALFRECLSKRLAELEDQSEVAAYARLRDLQFPYEKADSVLALLLSVPSWNWSASDLAETINLARCQLPQVPIVVIADEEELKSVRKVMNFEVRGYIPTSFGLTAFKAAIEFIRAGGTFIAAGAPLGRERQRSASREGRDAEASALFAHDEPRFSDIEGERRMIPVSFTRREQDVIDQLRQGKSNKEIARELGITEGTTKLHLQRIMRKLHVHNRTQAALLVRQPPLTPTDRGGE
jgi:DNA-binding NarL/FixJ family response regulator